MNVVIRVQILRNGTVFSDSESTRAIGSTATDLDGQFAFTFDWCAAIDPLIPTPGIFFQVRSFQKAFVEVRRPVGGSLVWTSDAIDLAATNNLRFDRNTSGPECDISPIPPTLEIRSPADDATYVIPTCPVRPCTRNVPFEVDVEGPRSIYHVGYEVVDADGVVVFQGTFCHYDPIEGTDCDSPPFTLHEYLALARGDWTIVVTAIDDQGLTARDEVQVHLFDESAETPGPIAITGVTPRTVYPPVELRGGADPKTTGRTRVTIAGENFHPFLRVYLSPVSTSLFPYEWVLYDAGEYEVKTGGGELSFFVPDLPDSTPVVNTPGGIVVDTYRAFWRVVIYDDYIRPDRRSMVVFPDPDSNPGPEDYVDMARPPYPYLHGFGFANAAQDAEFDQFLAVFGDSAYICVGPDVFGECLGVKIPDPLYWLGYWWVFRKWVNDSGGSCVGMSATSLMLHDGDLDPRDFDPDVYYAAGFDAIDIDTQWDYGFLGRVAGPPEPGNLWAWIRRNHGVQTTAEFVGEYLQDLELDGFGYRGNPVARLGEIRDHPIGEVICMASNDDGGHAVLPYGSSQQSFNLWNLDIYDNNNPVDPKTIEVDTVANTYAMTHRRADYSGTVAVTIPKHVFFGDHHMPGLSNLDDLLFMVLGDARPEVASGGGSWGWDAEGRFRQDLPGIEAVYPMGDVRAGNPLIVLPKGVDASVTAHARGGDYLFHAAQGGRFFQADVAGVAAGESDTLVLRSDGGGLRSLRVVAERAPSVVTPRVGMVFGERESAVFVWSGLAVVAGGEYAFTARNASRAVGYENASSRATRHMLVLHSADGASGDTATRLFGPFDVPAGAHHVTAIADWPQCTRLRSELDLDGDGVADVTDIVSGVDCGAPAEAIADGDADGTPDTCEQTTVGFVRGDCNGDGQVDVSDAIRGLAWLFQGGGPLSCESAADANDDDALDISDPIHTLGYLFLGTPPPPPPGPAVCGADPTPDDLTCLSPGSCF